MAPVIISLFKSFFFQSSPSPFGTWPFCGMYKHLLRSSNIYSTLVPLYPFFPMTFLDLKRLPVVQLANQHLIDYPTPATSTLVPFVRTFSSGASPDALTLLGSSPTPATFGESSEISSLSSSKIAKTRARLKKFHTINLLLGSATVGNRLREIISLLTAKHVESLKQSLFALGTDSSTSVDAKVVAFLADEKKAHHLEAYLYKFLWDKKTSFSGADQQIVLVVTRHLEVLGSVILFIETGEEPAPSKAKIVLPLAGHLFAIVSYGH